MLLAPCDTFACCTVTCNNEVIVIKVIKSHKLKIIFSEYCCCFAAHKLKMFFSKYCVALPQVRVYVDGQLAGFYPISYTMYTVSQAHT